MNRKTHKQLLDIIDAIMNLTREPLTIDELEQMEAALEHLRNASEM